MHYKLSAISIYTLKSLQTADKHCLLFFCINTRTLKYDASVDLFSENDLVSWCLIAHPTHCHSSNVYHDTVQCMHAYKHIHGTLVSNNVSSYIKQSL